ncbi:MAG: Pycsar system effector family protein [Verrucomicrobiales bacterium]
MIPTTVNHADETGAAPDLPSAHPPSSAPLPQQETDERPAYSHAAIYMLRTVHQHHVHLSAMADQKASILLGACLLVATICFSQIGNEAAHPSLYVWAAFSIVAAAVGVLAVLPRFGSKKKTRHNSHPNLLFFGSFAEMSDEQFGEAMLQVTRNDETVMQAMIRDIHQMGKVLRFKKYRYLALSYQVFLWGLLASLGTAVVTFLAAELK